MMGEIMGPGARRAAQGAWRGGQGAHTSPWPIPISSPSPFVAEQGKHRAGLRDKPTLLRHEKAGEGASWRKNARTHAVTAFPWAPPSTAPPPAPPPGPVPRVVLAERTAEPGIATRGHWARCHRALGGTSPHNPAPQREAGPCPTAPVLILPGPGRPRCWGPLAGLLRVPVSPRARR